MCVSEIHGQGCTIHIITFLFSRTIVPQESEARHYSPRTPQKSSTNVRACNFVTHIQLLKLYVLAGVFHTRCQHAKETCRQLFRGSHSQNASWTSIGSFVIRLHGPRVTALEVAHLQT